MADETVAHQPNLVQRNGTFYLRMRVPLDVVEALTRTHVVVSLRTKERRVALTRFSLEQARVVREFEATRRQAAETDVLRRALASGRLEKLSLAEVERLALNWFEHAVQHVARSARDRHDTHLVDWDSVLEEVRGDGSLLKSPNPDHYAPHVEGTINQLLLAAGMPPEPLPGRIKLRVRRPKVDRTTAQYDHLAALVRRGLIAVNRELAAQLTGEWEGGPPHNGPRLTLGLGERRTLDNLIHAFANDPGRGKRTGKTDADYAMVFLALREVVGAETDVGQITREHARRLRDLFLALPPNATKRFKGRTLTQAAETARDTALPTLNTQTVNSHLTKVATLFNWAAREEWIEKNPAIGLSIKEDHRSQRRPFSVEQLKSIFSAPIYTGCRNDEAGYAKFGPNRPRRARFWVPLLSLFHGMRLNECCQLRPHDVDERDGCPVIIVRATGGDQRVKSRAGTRVVPMHPEIIRLGFLDFVETCRKKGDERLFPELEQDSRGYFSDAFQKWFSRFLNSCGVSEVGTTFHSFRHGWTDRLREAGVPEDRRRALGGWADTGVDAAYGRGFPTKMLASDIASVNYPGLLLGHLHLA